MHAFLEAHMDAKPALQPKAAIGSSLRASAGAVLAAARTPIADPERPSRDAVHEFRRSMKQWRALMRLIEPMVADATRLRHEARDRARALASARDGQSALNALDDLAKHGLTLSERTVASIGGRLEALRASEERSVLAAAAREGILAWLDTAAETVEGWPLETVHFSDVAAGLTAGYRAARRLAAAQWPEASGADMHELRRRVVDHRYQMDLVEPLWPRFARMWTEEAERLRDRLGRFQDLEVLERLAGPHQPLAPWRSRLTPPCTEQKTKLSRRAARLAARLFAERPKAFRRRLETLWEVG